MNSWEKEKPNQGTYLMKSLDGGTKTIYFPENVEEKDQPRPG